MQNNHDLLPSVEQTEQHLSHLFGGLPENLYGAIELSWTPPTKKGPTNTRYFSPSNIREAAQFACSVNSQEGQNIYVGAALRKYGIIGRASDADVIAVTCAYTDLDEADANLRAEHAVKHCPPSAIVVTGRTPHLRQQLWWRFDQPQTDLQEARRLNEAILQVLGGDPSAVNASRLMRLGGSIAWPKKPGRVPELTSFISNSEGQHV